ncbi:mannan-binding family protein [Mycolicibacterium novocastrense]|uniref:Conserved secreted protein n=1 Tax=Mycolicibacterium novocastrense TaxID=59813 RepID=A0AAW5SRH6_MYCNV|nr:mannan-binding family protein [Mycolicibacterium novocastrense]MCV7026160.1 mannan-binding family protein [Mycolicibacterium novocastrense]GAT10467.1 conserved secreted protein [Mycolicibacterium novocastrense]
MRLLSPALAATAMITAVVAVAPTASASAPSFCAELGGHWDGQFCSTSVVSERKATRNIKMALPGDLVDNPTIREYLTNLMNNWRDAAKMTVHDSFGEQHFQIFQHGGAMTVVFHEMYSGTVGTDALAHPNAPIISDAYRTFTFADGRRLQLADLFKPGVDHMAEIPCLGAPFIVAALDAAPPPHQPGTYPFTPDRWTPDKVYSGAYKAWALTPDELILYMPDYPVARDRPINFSPGLPQWAMDGGTVQAHIPLSALAPILRPEFGGG